ncbi:hypothetical protein B0H67DRAFT_646070 [Lasiosphaeris hirsuta]|uniref:Heterokaryon incompatibility domain-containing protein n=1 Tax=Lasiosphaeris hirsuta TaxID=260670 RepID=A0AA40DSS3_9PEZI|nr:hypothetical protein B0H67DRAFT_646070 [Lasiosphaeris hirsuta]
MSAEVCKSCNRPPLINPNLCDSCQLWNNFTHYLQCAGGDTSSEKLDNYRQFCYVCQREQTGTRIAPKHTLEDFTYHDLDTYQSRHHCMLCRVLGDLLQEYANQYQTVLNLQFGTWKPLTVRHADSTCKHDGPPDDDDGDFYSTTEICVLPGAIRMATNGTSTYKLIVVKLAFHFADHQFNLQSIQPWTPRPTLPLSKINRWLANCTANHGPQCNDYATSMTTPPGLRLIDTLTRCITMPTTPVPYVALSYCWASATTSQGQDLQLLLSNLARLSQPDALTPAVLPAVLADAIQLCRDLSQRHLWIDALCII